MYDQFASHVHKSIATRKDLLLEIDNLNSEKGGQEQKGRPVDLLQALLDCQDPESKVHLNGPQIHAESLLLLIGGIDPTAYTLTWTTHLFMLYPECYRRAVNEVRQRFPLSDLETTPEISYAMAKASLPYLEACIYESMRLVPVPHMLIPRVVPEEGTTIKDHFIPGGSTVFCNILGSHLNPKYWQDPHRFSPERFLDPATRRTAIHSVFTFGYGNRICLGKHLAWLNMTTILANLLRRFDFKLPDGYTRTGPNIIDPDTGHPKLMDKTEFITAKPVDYVKDCALVITAAQV
ncbi:hypothetical protein IWW50_005250 [Coemansia erecta]|nr:hypothetical protein IWW50_005250 [Coemansia erecta]